MPRDIDARHDDQTDFARITSTLSRRGFIGAAGLGAFSLATTALTRGEVATSAGRDEVLRVLDDHARLLPNR